MLIRDPLKVCSGCGGDKFKQLPMEDKKADVRKCRKCNNICDFSLKSEDVKHGIYEREGKEPDDKQNITENED